MKTLWPKVSFLLMPLLWLSTVCSGEPVQFGVQKYATGSLPQLPIQIHNKTDYAIRVSIDGRVPCFIPPGCASRPLKLRVSLDYNQSLAVHSVGMIRVLKRDPHDQYLQLATVSGQAEGKKNEKLEKLPEWFKKLIEHRHVRKDLVKNVILVKFGLSNDPQATEIIKDNISNSEYIFIAAYIETDEVQMNTSLIIGEDGYMGAMLEVHSSKEEAK